MQKILLSLSLTVLLAGCGTPVAPQFPAPKLETAAQSNNQARAEAVLHGIYPVPAHPAKAAVRAKSDITWTEAGLITLSTLLAVGLLAGGAYYWFVLRLNKSKLTVVLQPSPAPVKVTTPAAPGLSPGRNLPPV